MSTEREPAEVVLPELPHPARQETTGHTTYGVSPGGGMKEYQRNTITTDLFTPEQMRAYARSAVEMNRGEDAQEQLRTERDNWKRWCGEAEATAAGNALSWAVDRWIDEVKHRPLDNVHRRTLDDTWRQVMRHFGGDPDAVVGPSHDALLAAMGGKGGEHG